MKHTLILLIAFFWGHWAFAELPQSLDEVLFGISGGTNYVKWMRTDGMLKYRFMENVEEPLGNRVFLLRDFSYRVR